MASDAVSMVGKFNQWNPKNGRDTPDFCQQLQNKDVVHIIHVDASNFGEGRVTVGCVIKDHYQTISLAVCKIEEVSVDVSMAEALAIKWGMCLAKSLNLERIALVSDAKEVVDCVNFILVRPVLDPIVLDIR